MKGAEWETKGTSDLKTVSLPQGLQSTLGKGRNGVMVGTQTNSGVFVLCKTHSKFPFRVTLGMVGSSPGKGKGARGAAGS